jgi:hypothetical protein
MKYMDERGRSGFAENIERLSGGSRSRISPRGVKGGSRRYFQERRILSFPLS